MVEQLQVELKDARAHAAALQAQWAAELAGPQRAADEQAAALAAERGERERCAPVNVCSIGLCGGGGRVGRK
eukprot:364700-Chlamydomonas_euryale.AAC.2